jgi:hypothetical protein
MGWLSKWSRISPLAMGGGKYPAAGGSGQKNERHVEPVGKGKADAMP